MKRPIGFIDSGVGGLTVLKEALKQLPNESMIFLGDSARCPYGTRPKEEIRQYTLEMVQFLLQKNIKMLLGLLKSNMLICGICLTLTVKK